jgi:hypothetical protein
MTNKGRYPNSHSPTLPGTCPTCAVRMTITRSNKWTPSTPYQEWKGLCSNGHATLLQSRSLSPSEIVDEQDWIMREQVEREFFQRMMVARSESDFIAVFTELMKYLRPHVNFDKIQPLQGENNS